MCIHELRTVGKLFHCYSQLINDSILCTERHGNLKSEKWKVADLCLLLLILSLAVKFSLSIFSVSLYVASGNEAAEV